jgi:hypothetical protein
MKDLESKFIKYVKRILWIITPVILTSWAVYGIYTASHDNYPRDTASRIICNGKYFLPDIFLRFERYVMTEEQVSKLMGNPNQKNPERFNVQQDEYDGQLYYVIRLHDTYNNYQGHLMCYFPTKEIYSIYFNTFTDDYRNVILPVPVKAKELKKLGSKIKTKWSNIYWQ